jgi:hypothetical protein
VNTDLNFVYTPAQQLVFFNTAARFVIVSKGRRVGLTRGAAQAFVEASFGKVPQRLLWGETIYSNVQRYYDDYFYKPYLSKLPESQWSWSQKIMQLTINGTVIDFRSADNPETWEGFGYNLIFLNEAGIILRNADLYKKTVLPMLLDFPDSRMIAAGVPKGKKLRNGEPHPFYELWERAEKNPLYARYKFSTYENPFLSVENIAELISTIDAQSILQEIDGEFIDQTENPYLYAFDAKRHVIKNYEPRTALPIWLSFDFNIEPNSCIVGQQPDQYSGVVFDEISVKGSTVEVCNVIKAKYSHWLQRGLVYVTGDATGKNRNAISGETTNYMLIKKTLNLRDYNLKVSQTNMLLKSSRILCNSILDKAEVFVTENCKQVVTDCQIADVDIGGELIKDSGLHKFDCFRYILEKWFPDFVDKGHKYIRPGKLPTRSALERSVSEKEKLKPVIR